MLTLRDRVRLRVRRLHHPCRLRGLLNSPGPRPSAASPDPGKSSLARDVAEELGWRYLAAVVTSRTQARDLQRSFDAVRRLTRPPRGSLCRAAGFRAAGRAVAGIQRRKRPAAGARGKRDRERRSRSWRRARSGEDRPAVVLIDEIDKADPDVPNDLLVPFGSLTFEVTETHESVTAPLSRRPLLVLTTNEERDLPPAFLRRSAVLKLRAPNQDRLVSIAARIFRTQTRRGCAGSRSSSLLRRPSPPRSRETGSPLRPPSPPRSR